MAYVVVFGGAGFIGTHLLQKLASEGEQLISVDLRQPKYPVAGVKYIQWDVRDLSNLTIDGDISRIYNLAAVHTTPGHPDHEYYETNILGATEIAAFAERRGVNEIIFTSSISVYGPGEEEKVETTPLMPVSAYGRSKRMAEVITRHWFEREPGRRLVICRPAVIFGRGEGGNFTRLAKLLKKGAFIYPGRRDTIKACFYVEDLVDALEFARRQPDPFTLFNGCYPDRYTIENIVSTLQSKYFKDARTYLVPSAAIYSAAKALQPFSVMGLGIHPDRVLKLIRSTDVTPGWLTAHNAITKGMLPSAIDRWAATTSGTFE